MKILILLRGESLYGKASEFMHVPEGVDVTFYHLGEDEQKFLKSTLNNIDLSSYDRVVLKLKFHYIKNSYEVLSKIDNLVIVEEDSCGNFMINPRYMEFEYFFHKIHNAKLLVTGLHSSIRFQKQGLNSRWVSKSCDTERLGADSDFESRSIEFGFIGTSSGYLYRGRRKMLHSFNNYIPVDISQTTTIEEYRERLNKVQFFISADIGFDEYMIKNFEAMACGCVLVAYRVGGEETLGFQDMENVILYSTADEALKKIKYVKDKGLATIIAHNGANLVSERHSYKQRNIALYNEICSLPVIPFYADRRSAARKLCCNTLHNPLIRKGLRKLRKVL